VIEKLPLSIADAVEVVKENKEMKKPPAGGFFCEEYPSSLTSIVNLHSMEF